MIFVYTYSKKKKRCITLIENESLDIANVIKDFGFK